MAQKGSGKKKIHSVEARVHPLMLELTGKKTPKDELHAKVSVYHSAALGPVYSKATPAQYKDRILTDDHITHIRDKVVAIAEKDIKADETHITVKMIRGQTFKKHIEHTVGSLEEPMTDQQLESKISSSGCSYIRL